MEYTSVEIADIAQRIKRMLVEDLQLRVVADDIPDNYSLLEGGLALDSILIAELIATIEDRLGLQFDERVFQNELFDDLSVLAAFVAGECATASSKGGEVRSGGSTC